jgi:hypothetical protein
MMNLVETYLYPAERHITPVQPHRELDLRGDQSMCQLRVGRHFGFEQKSRNSGVVILCTLIYSTGVWIIPVSTANGVIDCLYPSHHIWAVTLVNLIKNLLGHGFLLSSCGKRVLAKPTPHKVLFKCLLLCIQLGNFSTCPWSET